MNRRVNEPARVKLYQTVKIHIVHIRRDEELSVVFAMHLEPLE